jgi:hypothetical protein
MEIRYRHRKTALTELRGRAHRPCSEGSSASYGGVPLTFNLKPAMMEVCEEAWGLGDTAWRRDDGGEVGLPSGRIRE